jgi:hypothetical protein
METDARRGVLVIFANLLANEVELKSIGLRWYSGAGAVAAESNPSHFTIFLPIFLTLYHLSIVIATLF